MSEGAVAFHVAGGEQFVPRLFAELGVPIRSIRVARPTLDDVFMTYTGRTIRDAEASGEDRMRSAPLRARATGAADDGRRSTAPVAAVREAGGGLRDDLRAVRVVWRRELLRFSRNRLRMVTSLMQPVLFLFVLGTGLSTMMPVEPRASTSARSCSRASSR